METIVHAEPVCPDVLRTKSHRRARHLKTRRATSLPELERGVYAALETYSNVHRGSGTTRWRPRHLYEQRGRSSWRHLGLAKGNYDVVFLLADDGRRCSGAAQDGSYRSCRARTSAPSRVAALGSRRRGAPAARPSRRRRDGAAGGPRLGHLGQDAGQVRAGTPAITNVIAFRCRLAAAPPIPADDAFRGGPATATPAETRSAADILHHDALAHLSGLDLLDACAPTLIGRASRSPRRRASGPSSTWTMPPAPPPLRPSGTPSAGAATAAPVRAEIIREVRAICRRLPGRARGLRSALHRQHHGGHPTWSPRACAVSPSRASSGGRNTCSSTTRTSWPGATCPASR